MASSRKNGRVAAADREIPVRGGRAWSAALRAWDQRLEEGAAREAAELFRDLAEREESADAWAWCARSRFFLGDYAESSREKKRWFEEGLRLGREGVAREERHLGACFWTAACVAKYVEATSLLRAPVHAPEIVRLLKRVAEEDMMYAHGGPARFVGLLHARKPAMTERLIKLAMPGVWPDVVLEILRHFVEQGPPFVLNVQVLGEVAFHVNRDRATVREMLRRLDVLDLDAYPATAPENHLDLPRARQRLKALL
jgi:hypothetical protein